MIVSWVVNFTRDVWVVSRISDAEQNLGESEVREAHLAKSLFYIKISDKVGYIVTGSSNFAAFFDIFSIYMHILLMFTSWLNQERALKHLKLTESKTVAVGQKMDLVFYTLNIGFFYLDFDLISKSIDKAKRWACL